MPDFIVGERYPMTAAEVAKILRFGWPAVRGEADLSRGRRFLEAPCHWEFWLTTGHKVDFLHAHGGVIVSQSREPDPDLPPPLTQESHS